MSKTKLLFILSVISMLNNIYITYAENQHQFDLTTVQTLTFYKDKMTTGKRHLPISQLECIGGDAEHWNNEIETIQCYNKGTNEFGDVQWECSTATNGKFKLSQTIVSCEGYMNSDDHYKLAGSCGLKYALLLTDEGKSYLQDKNGYTFFEILYWSMFVIFVCGLLYNCLHTSIYKSTYKSNYTSSSFSNNFWTGYLTGTATSALSSKNTTDTSTIKSEKKTTSYATTETR